MGTKFKIVLFFITSVLAVCIEMNHPAFADAETDSVKVGYFLMDGYQNLDESGNYSGYGYEYLQELRKYTGWNYEYIHASFSDCLTMLENGEIDLMGSVRMTPERQEIFDYAALHSGISTACLFAREDDTRYAYQDFSSFNGMTVGMLEGNSRDKRFHDYCAEKGFKVNQVKFSTEQELVEALNNRQVDSIMMNSLRDMEGYRVITQFSPSPFYFATTKGNVAILQKLNEGMEQIKAKSPYFDSELYNKYYPSTTTGVPVFTKEEQAFIDHADIIPVGLSDGRNALSDYSEQTQSFTGITIDIMSLISEKSGLKFSYSIRPGELKAVDYLQNSGARIAAPLMLSDAVTVSDQLVLIPAKMDSSLVLVGRQGGEFDPLGQFTIALPREMANTELYMRERYPNADIIFEEDDLTCLKMILDGKADITFENIYTAHSNLQRPIYEGLYIFTAYYLKEEFAIAVLNADNMLLQSILQKTMESLTEQELDRIIMKYTMAKNYEMTLEDIFYKFKPFVYAVSILLVMIVSLLAAIMIIRQRNYRKLESSNERLKQALEEKESANDARNKLEAQKIADEKYQAELRNMIEYDDVSGLYSRRAFYIHVRERLDADPEGSYAVVRCDIDRFKAFNDIFGTRTGDKLLNDLGQFFKEMDQDGIISCRLQSDHYVSLWPMELFDAERLSQKLQQWFQSYPLDFNFAFCLGIYVIDDTSLDVALMCDRALLALRTIKERYNERYAFYDKALRDKLMLEQGIINEMTQALETGQFVVYFQPQFRYSNRKMVGAEALVRWQHPQKGLISPAVFIPIFEKNGFIASLDQFVWEQVCVKMREWLDKGMEIPVSVNISRTDIEDPDLCRFLEQLVKKYEIPPRLLKLEITESVYMRNPVKLIEVVKKLQNRRFTVEMDDFGSGYSSLNILKDVPVDVLKLDLKFLGGNDKARGGKILSSVVRMAHWLDLPIIAEGVETKPQADFLLSIGCDYMQGYYFAKPMPADEFEILMRRESGGEVVGRETEYISGFVEELWNPESELSFIFDNFTGGAAVIEYDGQYAEVIMANAGYLNVLGIKREEYELYRKDIFDRLFEEDRIYFRRMMEEAMEGGKGQCEVHTKPMGKMNIGGCYKVKAWMIARTRGSHIFYIAVERVNERRGINGNYGQ